MPDLICLIPNHGYIEDNTVYVSWLDDIYYVRSVLQNSFKISTDASDDNLVQFTTSITSGFVREDNEAGTATITGLGHLEGETVTVTSGGNLIGLFVVESGSVTLNSELTTYQVGIPYACKIRTTRLSVPQTANFFQGQIKKINSNTVRYIKTKDCDAGQEYRVKQVSGEDVFTEFLTDIDATFDSESRDAKVAVNGGSNDESYSVIKSTSPFPMLVVANIIDFSVEEQR